MKMQFSKNEVLEVSSNYIITNKTSPTNYRGTRVLSTYTKGKYYYEVTINNLKNIILFGVCLENQVLDEVCRYGDFNKYFGIDSLGEKVIKGSYSSFTDSLKNNDTVGVCLNFDEQEIIFIINGKNYSLGKKIFNESDKVYPCCYLTRINEKIFINFGEKRFKYSLPSGYKPFDYKNAQWFNCKYLLKQDDKYYSVKPQFYDKEKQLYIPCERDFEKNGIDDLSELTKEKCIDFCIGKKENIVNGSLFSFSLKNINSILNIISNNDKKNDELQIGNRKNLIKISCSSNLIEKGNIETLIDGEKEDNLWLNNGNTNESILFEFPYPVSITGINIIQSFINQQGIWELCGSNDNNKYISLNNSIEFNNKMNKFININSYKYYKLNQKSGETSRSSYVYEIEFDIQNIYYLLINEQGKYFTINNNNVIEMKEYIKNNDFYIKNGFNISNFNINFIKDYFDNVDDLNLFIFSELDNTELNIKYKLNKPFKPINCFKGKIELIKQEEK